MTKKKRKNLKNFTNITTNFGGVTKKAVKRLKQVNLTVNLVSVALITAGTIAGGITLNPIILGVITGTGLLIKTTSEMKKYANKIELFKIGLTTYEKTLVDLRSFLRGKEYFHGEVIRKINLVDGEIVDLYTIPEKIKKKYEKSFSKGFISCWKRIIRHRDIHQNTKLGFEFLQSKLLLLHRQVKGKNQNKSLQFSSQFFQKMKPQCNWKD